MRQSFDLTDWWQPVPFITNPWEGQSSRPSSHWKWLDTRVGSGKPRAVRNVGKGSVRRFQWRSHVGIRSDLLPPWVWLHWQSQWQNRDQPSPFPKTWCYSSLPGPLFKPLVLLPYKSPCGSWGPQPLSAGNTRSQLPSKPDILSWNESAGHNSTEKV